jgi:hypothetical protein
MLHQLLNAGPGAKLNTGGARGVDVEAADEFRWMFTAEYPAVVRTVYLVLHD